MQKIRRCDQDVYRINRPPRWVIRAVWLGVLVAVLVFMYWISTFELPPVRR